MLKTLSPENTRVNINAASHISFSLSYNLFGEFISFTHFQANKSGHFARTKNKFSPSQGFLTFPSKLNCGNKISLRHVLSANLTNQDTTLPYMAMVSLFQFCLESRGHKENTPYQLQPLEQNPSKRFLCAEPRKRVFINSQALSSFPLSTELLRHD